jgi:hypothetical protein
MIHGRLWHRGRVADDDTHSEESRRTGTRNRSALTWTVATAVVLLIAAAVVYGLLIRDSGDTPATAEPTGQPELTRTELLASPPTTRCMTPNPEVLRQQELAFDGVVHSVAGGLATLQPNRFYVGEATDVVVVKAPDGELEQLLAAVDFREGERYLVAATDGVVTVCGFTGPYSEQLAALYDEAFG